jgi:chromate reductase
MASTTVLAISGSLRARSSNTAVLRAAARVASADVRVVHFSGLDGLPHFNPDLDADGMAPPPGVEELRRQVEASDALLICSPEYAHGVPGSLKNALDWLVSVPALYRKPVTLLNASPRSVHAQAALVETLRTMSLTVVPDAAVVVPLRERDMDDRAIAEDPSAAEVLRGALESLSGIVADRRGRAEAERDPPFPKIERRTWIP